MRAEPSSPAAAARAVRSCRPERPLGDHLAVWKGVRVLPRSARLHRGADITRVSSRGARAQTDSVGVSVLLGAGASTRAAVVVGRRAGGAVIRNRHRRRLQHALVPVLNDVPAGASVLVRGGPEVGALGPAALQAALANAVHRAVRRAGPR
ncbi:MAG: ribonuclease P protein component [Mycobacteriales bacterium]